MKSLTTTAADDDDDHLAILSCSGGYDLIEHRPPDRLLGWQYVIRQIADTQRRYVCGSRPFVAEPDVSGHRPTPNYVFTGRRHFGNTNFTKEARLYHAGRDYTRNIFLSNGQRKGQLIINQNATFCA